jgi:hypothetical protein
VRSNSPIWLILLGAILAFGVWRLFELRFAHGDIYPPYSSLRADQYGSRALFDSIGGVAGFQVSRNFRPLEKIAPGARTVFYLGVSPNSFAYQPDEAFKDLEKLAAGGARVVIGFRSVPAERTPKRQTTAPVQKRWGVRFTFAKHVDPGEASQTALAFEPESKAWQGNSWMLERGFGRGSVLLLARSYPLSNEGLQKERATGLIAHMLGGNRQVVFDESHLGEVESGSVAGLARKYRLEGLAAALLALAGLYLWKNSVSFLPPRESEHEEILTSAKDASSGLANLLRRNIPASELIRTCVAQWEKDRDGARYPAAKVERVRAIANRGGDPAAAYAEIGRILK